MGSTSFIRHSFIFFLLLLCALGGYAATPSSESLQAFSTDGCSRFPDRAPNGKSDWCHCCVVHDLAYWRGGPHLPTSYRWGYGWPVGTPYRQLTPDEDSLASSLVRDYLAKDPLLMCPADTKPDH
jgi:hypothetical protein